MEQNIKLLIQLYSKHSLSELNSPDAGILFTEALNLKYTDIVNEGWYRLSKVCIEDFKRQIDDYMQNSYDSRQQIIKCLNYVWKECIIREYAPDMYRCRMEILEELIISTFDKKWSKKQMDHFKKVFVIFKDYHSFFLSYTNHSCKQINRTYGSILSDFLSKDDLVDENLENRNLLARVIFTRLRERNLRKGFYDYKSLRKGEPIDESIYDSVTKSFAFIQLIASPSFAFDESNYSFKEFSKYCQTHCKNNSDQVLKECFDNLFLYFIIEKEPYPNTEETPDEYEEWINTIKNKNHWEIYKEINTDNIKKIIDELIDVINANKSKLVEAVPD